MKLNNRESSNTKSISWDQWIEDYQPIIKEDGSLLDADPRCKEVKAEDFLAALKENRIWTECDSDQPESLTGTYIVSGQHIVNMNRYFITEKPFTQEVIVSDEKDEISSNCINNQ